MRISDWSSDVCSSDLGFRPQRTRSIAEDVHDRALRVPGADGSLVPAVAVCRIPAGDEQGGQHRGAGGGVRMLGTGGRVVGAHQLVLQPRVLADRRPHQEDFDMTDRSEEHTSELQSLMRNSYAVFCLKKKKHKIY